MSKGWKPYASEEEYWQELTHWGTLLSEACREETEENSEKAEALRVSALGLWREQVERSAASAEAGVFLPLPYLAAALRFTEPQEQCLALVLMAEAEMGFSLPLSAPGTGELTAGLALRLLGGGGLSPAELRSVLEPSGALAQYGLEAGGVRNGTDRILRPARRLVSFALEGGWDRPGTAGLTLRQTEGAEIPVRLQELAAQMRSYLDAAEGERTSFLLQGQPGAGRRTLALALAAELGAPLLLADGRRLSGEGGESFRRALLREALLQQCPVCLTGLEEAAEAARAERQAEEFLTELLGETAEACCSLLVQEEDWVPGGGPENWRAVPVALPMPEPEESRALWEEILEKVPQAEPQDPDRLAGKYRLTPGQMKRAVETAAAQARWRGLEGIDGDCLDRGCRAQLRHTLGDRARKVETSFSWEELILPESSKRLLRSACDQMRCRRRVYGEWGFGRKLPYGNGLSMLFSGPPGTGKTMAAQIAAGELGLELYKVDLSAVVSKYVGETEKNLAEIFREAARSQAALFFDEADVLFSKRTEVKDAHDKYNNMEAAYLLQKIEEYSGVSVLATNFLQNIDEAFKRRIRFIIEFPFPDEHYRRLLWNTVFPAQTPVEPEVDWDFLAAQFELSGSGIKNVAVNAAFLAAGAGTAVGMPQLLTALRRELYKSGKVLTREDFGQYYMLVEEGEYARL